MATRCRRRTGGAGLDALGGWRCTVFIEQFGYEERISRGEPVKDAHAWGLEMAVTRGSDEENGPCPGYAPGDWTELVNGPALVSVRLCKHCGEFAGDHVEVIPEPSDSQKRAVVPGPPDPVGEGPPRPTKLTPYQAACELISELMGPVETWFQRLREDCAGRLGRELNEHEVTALRSYVSGASLDLLRDLIRELAK